MSSISPTPREIASQRSTAMADGPGAIDITQPASTMREYPGAPTLWPRRGDDPGLSTFGGLRSKTRSRGARKLGKGEPHWPTSGDGSGARDTSGQRIELLLPEQLSSLGRQHANLKGDLLPRRPVYGAHWVTLSLQKRLSALCLSIPPIGCAGFCLSAGSHCGRMVISQRSGGASIRIGKRLVPTPPDTTIVLAPSR